MGVIIKQGSRSTFVSYIGVAIGMVNVMFLYPRFLTPELVGIMRLLLEVATILALFCQLGLVQAIIKFYPYFRNEKTNDHGFFFYVLLIPIIGIIIFSSLYLIFGDYIKSYYSEKSPLFINFYIFVIPFAIFLVFTNLFEAYLNARLKIVYPKIIREIVIRILIMLIIFGLYINFLNANEYLYAYIVIYGLAAVFLLLFIFKNEPTSLKPDLLHVSPNLKKEIIWYTTFMIIAGIGNSIVNKIDVLMLGAKLGTREIGIFSIAFFIASVVEMPYRSIGLISAPVVASAIKNNDWEQVKDVYKKSALNQLIIAGFIFYIIWINVDNIFSIMPNGEIYKQGIWVVLFIGLAKIIDSAAGINALIVGYSNMYKFTLIFILLLFSIAYSMNTILIPVFGITGSAIATVISIFTYNLTLSLTLWFRYHIQPFTSKIFWVFLIFSVLIALNYLIPFIRNAYLDSIIRSSIISIAFFILLLKLRVSNEITGIIKFWVDKVPVKMIRDLFNRLY